MSRRIFLQAAMVVFASSLYAEQPAEIEHYLQKTTRAYARCIESLSAARDASEAARAVENYAEEMKSVISMSADLEKKFPGFQTSEPFKAELAKRKVMQTFLELNDLLVQAHTRYGQQSVYREAEKSLVEAGLYGRGD